MRYTRDGVAQIQATQMFLVIHSSVCSSFHGSLLSLFVTYLQQMEEVKQVHFPFKLSSIFITSSLEMCDGVIFTTPLVWTLGIFPREMGNVEKEKDNVALIYDLVSGSLTVRFEVLVN